MKLKIYIRGRICKYYSVWFELKFTVVRNYKGESLIELD